MGDEAVETVIPSPIQGFILEKIDVGRLAEGIPVEVTIGALPDTRIEGRLTRITLTGRDEENATNLSR